MRPYVLALGIALACAPSEPSTVRLVRDVATISGQYDVCRDGNTLFLGYSLDNREGRPRYDGPVAVVAEHIPPTATLPVGFTGTATFSSESTAEPCHFKVRGNNDTYHGGERKCASERVLTLAQVLDQAERRIATDSGLAVEGRDCRTALEELSLR